MVTNRVLIPEGKTVIDTFKILSEKTGIPVAEFEAAAKDPVRPWHSGLLVASAMTASSQMCLSKASSFRTPTASGRT